MYHELELLKSLRTATASRASEASGVAGDDEREVFVVVGEEKDMGESKKFVT
jgi:hypothetical protein